MAIHNNKVALNNRRIAEIRDEIIPQADVILGKSERAPQKPIKIGSPSDLVQSTEVVAHADIDATVQRLLGDNPGPAAAQLNANENDGRVKDFNGDTHGKVTLIEANARKNPGFFGFTPVPFKLAIVQKHDAQGNHVGEFRYNPDEISIFTSKDTYTKMAITSIDDYLLSHATRPKQIAIKGNIKEEMVWEMMLYCQHKGIIPVNKTRHSELTDRFNEMMQEAAQNRTPLKSFSERAQRLYPDKPEIYMPVTQREEMDRQMRPGRGR